MRALFTASAIAVTLATAVAAQQLPSDIPKTFKPVDMQADYERRVVEIPMRDGVKLHTVIFQKRGVTDAPIILQRTPYGADGPTGRDTSPSFRMVVRPPDAMLIDAGYIRVWQDVRGKHGSQGAYVNERPLIGPLNGTKVDHSTDAYDTIDWLVKNLKNSNGRVGITGTSYDGMMAAMALVKPHPALKAAVPMNPVINTWMGDDDFHGGAYRMVGYDYYFSQDTAKGSAGDLWRDDYDDYNTFLKAVSASGFARSRGLFQLPVAQRLHDHPTYDAYWQAQALETILPRQPQTVPTLWVASQWDQEDIYGAIAAYMAVSKVDPDHVNHLAIGPWAHGGANGDGSTLGALRFDSDTALWFRREVLLPFWDAHLKTNAPAAAPLAPVVAFQTGTNRWQSLPGWPLACPGTTCAAPMRRLYFAGDGGLASTVSTGTGTDSYVSDPARPIPYRLRPIRPTYASGSTWRQWLVDDQRPFSDRPDVLVYQTEPLTEPVAISGAAIVDLVASTTGTDGDFVAKLIDVYPAEYGEKPEMSGYQLPVAMDILRGRYRNSFSAPEPITPGAMTGYKIQLPHANHVFLPGHRIMIQVQSSWFPLYDRNPQTYVPNIFDARPADYRKATITIGRGAAQGSYVELPVVPAK
ncbi:CocE/NonD family hydrolase [Sphingomonas sp. A2-49]|uniref:CocE/NonD family hydrolase n=1 Tax=Sphingomonas sp. A2-49 TaxID=1391375 RepID=UPI0021D121A3|nr:CocE/NonD family hydrolase [Sphingomonas sp. A2-49]MCU6452582.1 CocE/NonD family hydrolase [Sphingomonas sp. A2-49]